MDVRIARTGPGEINLLDRAQADRADQWQRRFAIADATGTNSTESNYLARFLLTHEGASRR